MAKAGKPNVKFLHTGFTRNMRVYMMGEVATIQNVFRDDQPLDPEEQIEIYHKIFYELTEDAVTDPQTYVAPRDPTVHKLNTPQMAEVASPRNDGLGSSEIGGKSAASAEYPLPKGAKLTSDTPLILSEKDIKKERELEAAGGTKKLVFKFGGKKNKNEGGRSKKLVDAKATQLSPR